MDQLQDNPDEQFSPGQAPPQPDRPEADNPRRIPPLHNPAFHWRLRRLRDRHFAFLNSLATMFNIVLFLIFMYVTVSVCYLMVALGVAFSGFGSSSSGFPFDGTTLASTVLVVLGAVFAIGLPLVLVGLLRPAVRRQVDGMFQNRYRLAASYLHHTDFLRVVAEEDFTEIIIAAVSDVPSLRWISPARPKTLEQQLEFSACYWNSILQLSYGPGRLDNASLINGSWTHLMSRVSPYMCCACCCMSSYYFWIFTLPMLIMTCNYHLYRVARVCCIIDYISGDPFAVQQVATQPLLN